MTTTTRRDAALALMANTGILKSNYYPPIVRLLWRLGFAMPLPHFVSFGRVALVSGVFFGAAWAVMMTLVVAPVPLSPMHSLLAALGGGAFFGLSMALYYAHGRRKHKLPLWRDLPGA